jgi:hypothetical protein
MSEEDWTPEEIWYQAKQEEIGLGVSECDIAGLQIELELFRLKAGDEELNSFFFRRKEDELLIIRGVGVKSYGDFAALDD